MLRWFRKIFSKRIHDRLQHKDDQLILPDDPKFVWCLVGNIIDGRPVDANYDQPFGTKHFSPGTKVYCMPAQWGDGYEKIMVIGRHRKSKRYASLIMPAKFITNWRLQKVFRPYILNVIKSQSNGWTNSESDKQKIVTMLTWLPERTIVADKA